MGRQTARPFRKSAVKFKNGQLVLVGITTKIEIVNVIWALLRNRLVKAQ